MIPMTEGGQALVLNVKGLDGGKTRTLISSPKHIIRRAGKQPEFNSFLINIECLVTEARIQKIQLLITDRIENS